MSTANKLTYLNTTKQDLKTVINTTGAGLTNESTFRSYANVLNDKILGAINGDVDLFEEYPKVSGNGTDLSLNGVVEGKMSITPQGVSSQESTTGKNLFHILDWTEKTVPKIGTNGVSLTKVSNNKIILTSAGVWSNIYIDFGENFFNTNQDIITSADFLETISERTSKVGLQFYGSVDGSSYTSINTTGGTDITYNTKQYLSVTANTGEYAYIRLRIWGNISSTSVSRGDSVINVSNIMLALGTDDTYEPYTGGIPAPNPSYPYPVNNVTGENSLVISNSDNTETQSYSISLGNIELNSSPDGTIRDGIIGSSDVSYNLFDGVYYNTYTGGSSPYPYANNSSTRSGIIKVKPNTTYTITKELSSRFRMSEYAEYPIANTSNAISYIFPTNGDNLTSYTLTTSNSTNYLVIQVSNTSEENVKMQVIEGSEVKPYFPYGQVGMWYKREYIGKVVLNGSENWTFYSSSAMKFALDISGINKPATQDTLPNILSDKFKQSTWNNATNSDNYLITVSTSKDMLRIKDNDFSTLADFKAWLSSNNTTVYYPLAEYTDIPITDTTLINQLNDIYNNAHSYNGVTNITTTYEDGNEQMYLDIEALKNVWEVTE